MNRADLKQVSMIRQREARALLDAGLFHGSYYLLGYAVECALKACVAKQVNRFDFPNKELTNKVYTHNLEQLVSAAGLAEDLANDKKARRPLALNWATANEWREESRYNPVISEKEARDMYSACTEQKDGILPWIRERW